MLWTPRRFVCGGWVRSEAQELASWASMAPESLLRMLSAHGQHATGYALVLGVNVHVHSDAQAHRRASESLVCDIMMP